MRVKQNVNVNSINVEKQRLSTNKNNRENESNYKINSENINKNSCDEKTQKVILKRLSASDEKKSISRGKSCFKPSVLNGKGSLGGGLITTLLHSLGEEDDASALHSDAWLNI